MKYLVPLIVTAGLCWVLFTHFDFARMMQIIRDECNFYWIAAAALVEFLTFYFRAYRWRIQLRALDITPSRRALVYSIFGTYAVNLVLPRLGEVWRSGYIAQRQKAPFATVFGSMVGERLADTITVAIITLFTFIFSSSTISDYLRSSGDTTARIGSILFSPWLWIAVVAAIAAIAWILRRGTGPKISRVRNFIREFWQGIAVLAKMPGKWPWLGYTVLLWGGYFLQMVFTFQAFGFSADVYDQYGLIAVLTTFVISSIAMGVPSNGGIGPYQWAVMFALQIYGVAADEGAAFGNLALGVSTIMIIILGLYTFAAIALEKRNKPSQISPK